LSSGAHAAVFIKPVVPEGGLGRHAAPVRAVAISADGRVAASLDEQGELALYDLETGRRTDSLRAEGARHLALSPSVVAWGAAKVVVMHNHMAGREVWRWEGEGDVRALAVIQLGAALAVGDGRGLVVLRTATGRVVQRREVEVDALAWDGAGGLMVVGAGRWSHLDASLAAVRAGGQAPEDVVGCVAAPGPWWWRADGRLCPANPASSATEAPIAEGPYLAVGPTPGGWIACDARAVRRFTATDETWTWEEIRVAPGTPTCVAGHPSGAHVVWGTADGHVGFTALGRR
jgi:hypothetical protein